MVCTCSRVHRSRDDVRTTQTCAQPGRSQLRKITFLSRVGPEHGSRQVLASAENRPRRIGCVLGSRAPSRTCIVRRCVMKICPSQALTSSGCTAREHKTRKAHLTGSWVRRRLGHTWSKARWCLPIFPTPEAGVVVRTRFVQSRLSSSRRSARTGKIGRRSRGLRQVAPGSVSQRGPLARADGELETRSSDHRCPGKRPLRFFGVNFADKTSGGGLPARRSSWGPCGLPRSHGVRLTINSAILDP